mmetsp:Transcript_2527/g.4130  ORF Transcript_2527/g.4130 Transcript_2527/m.4130 type:complete len:875 (+) Transcript_2527:39-2663(+)
MSSNNVQKRAALRKKAKTMKRNQRDEARGSKHTKSHTISSKHKYGAHRSKADSSAVFAIDSTRVKTDDGASDDEDLLTRLTEVDEIDDDSDEDPIEAQLSALPSTPTNVAKSLNRDNNNNNGGGGQYRTLELRELRKYESLTAFGQHLSEIKLESAEWCPQRLPNKAAAKGHDCDVIAIQSDEDERNRCRATATEDNGYVLEKPNRSEPRPINTRGISLEETQHEVYLYRDNFLVFEEDQQVLTVALEHHHWLGVMTLPGTGKGKKGKQEPIAITLTQTDYFNLGRFIGIVRTIRSDHAFSIEASQLGKNQQAPKPKQLLAAMRKINPLVKDSKLWLVEDARVCEKLLVFEDVMKYWNYKFGVVYCKAGQSKEEEMLSNCQPHSKTFERFLNFLGQKIKLQGWEGYTADLDTKMNASGEESVFTQWHDFSIMFHVSTLLPFEPNNPQQVGRKRFIGNDLVTIVFQDGDAEFVPPCIVSNMLHVFVVIQPLTIDDQDCYKVSIVRKQGVPQFGPPIGDSLVFVSGPYFREWLLTKLVNAERASLHHPWLAAFIKKTRRGQLDDILTDFVDQRKKESKSSHAAPAESIVATAQTVARLKKRNRSQQQTPQAIARSGSASSSGSYSNATAERLDGNIDWICDQCNKEAALYKVMIATGVHVTLCQACADSKGVRLADDKTKTRLTQASSAPAKRNSHSPVVTRRNTSELPSTPSRALLRAQSSSNVMENDGTPRPAGKAPAPPSFFTPSGKRGGVPATSPRDARPRSHMSLDTAELEGALQALAEGADPLTTPIRATSRPRATPDSNRRDRAHSSHSKSGRKTSSLRTEKAKSEATPLAFEKRLAELDRRIQQLNESSADAAPPLPPDDSKPPLPPV